MTTKPVPQFPSSPVPQFPSCPIAQLPSRRRGPSAHRPFVPLLILVATLVSAERSAWAQSCPCVDLGPPGCKPDCNFDDIGPDVLPGCAGCVEPQDIPAPPSPRCPSDRSFVQEETAYSCDGWGNPIEKTIHVTRYVGPTKDQQELCPDPENLENTFCTGCCPLVDPEDYVAKGRLGATAELSIMAWDMDSTGSSCFPDPEVDAVSFNGKPLGRLRGSNQRWALTKFTVPIEYVNFPEAPGTGSNAPSAAKNIVKITAGSLGLSDRYYATLARPSLPCLSCCSEAALIGVGGDRNNLRQRQWRQCQRLDPAGR